MKVLLCHNYYQQPGGEDRSFSCEAEMLESNGHEVVRYLRHNDDVDRMSRWEVACKTLWNRQTYAELRRLIRRERPRIMHCTNTFPLISPAAYYAARKEGIPVVQSLRNYRLICPGALLLRDGRVCEDCLGKSIPWPCVRHRCYRNSHAASAVVAAMLSVHRAIGTWTRAVDVYYALTEFSRRKFIQAGMPAEKIAVKPNFVHPDPGPGTGRGGYAVFVGRLSAEKGIDSLLAAWAGFGEPVPLKIVGDGPLADRVRRAAASDPRITWLGRRQPEQVGSIVGNATFLVMPSLCYEGLPRTILEAFAAATPVIASRLGSMVELVDDGRTGLHFEPGNAADLAAKVRQLAASTSELAPMRHAARRQYEQKYTAEQNYQALMTIYRRALGGRLPVRGRDVQAVGPRDVEKHNQPVSLAAGSVGLGPRVSEVE